MPGVASGKVLVTGVTGFIAPHVVQALLQQGYAVRCTLRSEAKGAPYKDAFAEYGDKFQLVVVPDMLKDDAFDEAVQGVDAIMHLASPNRFDLVEPEDFIRPAVCGVKGILTSAMTHGASVRRVVFTSSVAAVMSHKPLSSTASDTPTSYDETDWNDAAVQAVRTQGRAAEVVSKYSASKVESERAAWAFMVEHKDGVKFDLVTLHPPWVLGPCVVLNKQEELGQSMAMWWNVVRSGKGDAVPGGEWVDVRDLAQAEVLAMQKDAAGGNRMLISAGPFQFQHWINAAHAFDEKMPAGNPSLIDVTNTYCFDASKAVRLLDVKYRTIEESAKDILGQFKGLGWIV